MLPMWLDLVVPMACISASKTMLLHLFSKNATTWGSAKGNQNDA